MLQSCLLIAFAVQTPTPYTWKNVEIVGGGFVSGIITHPKAKDVVYARTDIGGAYRWNPKTNRWVPLQDWITRPDWNLYGVESLAIDPSDPKYVYIAAGTYTNNWAGNGAFLRSADQGETWTRFDLPFKNGGNMDGRSMGERLTVDATNGSTLFFATRNNGLLRSDDKGTTWKPVKVTTEKLRFDIGTIWALSSTPKPNRGRPAQLIYVGVATEGKAPKIYRSENSGASFAPIPGQPTELLPHQAKLGADGSLYVVYGDAPGPNGITQGAVWKYVPFSNTWTNLTPELASNFGYGGIALDAKNPKTIMVSTLCRWSKGDTVFRSTDGGANWISLKDYSHRDSSRSKYLNWGKEEAEFGHWIGDVEIDPFNPDRAWYVTGATIWSTRDLKKADQKLPTNWLPVAEGLEETAVLDLVSPPNSPNSVMPPLLSGLGDIGGFRHDDLTKSPEAGMWTNPLLSNTDGLDYAGWTPEVMVRIGRGNGNQHGAYSSDAGKTWKPMLKDPVGRGGGSVAIGADNHFIVWCPENGDIQLSANKGATWEKTEGDNQPSQIVSDKSEPSLFYALSKTTGDFLICNFGISFRVLIPKLAPKAGKMVAVYDRRADVWIPTGTELHRVRSRGVGQGLQTLPVAAEQIGFGAPAVKGGYPTIFIIGTVNGQSGLFRSLDEGKTWSQINDAKSGFGTMQVIEGDPKVFGRVYIGTNGRGIIYGDPKVIAK